MHGTQLKALQGVRLPLSEAEWEAVRETLVSLAAWLRDGSSPEIFLAELKELAAYCEEWWENRTKREGAFLDSGFRGTGALDVACSSRFCKPCRLDNNDVAS